MELIKGDTAVDDRGQVSFVNGFDFKDVKRFYIVENHSKGFVRAWHGHKKEAKYVFVTKGAILLYAGSVDNWQSPDKRTDLFKFVLSGNKPQILFIPAGHVNGFKTLTDDTQVMFFSTTTLEESKGDDYRYPIDYWSKKIWEVEER